MTTTTFTRTQWLNKKEIAKHFNNVSTRTIENWMLEGMPYHQAAPHSKVLFDLEECERWYRSRKVAA
jgi:phage terminase Nu1 subunit (DNA packaging protein)